MSQVTFADKDKTIKDGVRNKLTDANINEIKAVANSKLDADKAGAAGGVATLDGSGKIPSGQLPGGGVGGNPFCGNYAADGGDFPTSGGNGPAGAILRSDTFDITLIDPNGSVLLGDTPGKLVYNGSTVRALIDAPGQDPANWKVSNG